MTARLHGWLEGARQADAWQDRPLSEHARLELLQDENATAYLEVVAGSRAASALARLVPRVRAHLRLFRCRALAFLPGARAAPGDA